MSTTEIHFHDIADPVQIEQIAAPMTNPTNRKARVKPQVASAREEQAAPSRRAAENKSAMLLKRLRGPKGVTIAQLMDATGWQAHSIRGFLSGTVKKKLGLVVSSEPGKDGVRRYRIGIAANAG